MFAQNMNVTFRAQLQYPNETLANICGYVDSLGNEYALVGAQKGMSIVDVTNPSAPVNLVQIPGPDNLWKEIKVRGKYAYVTSEGGQGLQIINLSSLLNVAGIITAKFKQFHCEFNVIIEMIKNNVFVRYRVFGLGKIIFKSF